MKNRYFWGLFLIILITIIILSVLNKHSKKYFLVVDNGKGEEQIFSFDQVYTIIAIPFETIKVKIDEVVQPDVLEAYISLIKFYDEYNSKTLIKAFYFDQLIRAVDFAGYDYKIITFHSGEGASVLVEPKEMRDFLILLTIEKHRGKYSLRLILPNDSFKQRWLKNIERITIEYD
jgi:hypothetical protein